MTDSRFEYRGDLAATPLAEVLVTVHHYKVPGVLTASRGGVEKKVFIWKGDVIFASSSDREDSLGVFLMRTGRITEEEHDLSVRLLLAPNETRRHGAVLVGMGVLSSKDLIKAVTEQVRAIVHSIFGWPDGSVTFQVGQYRTDEIIQLHIPTRHAVLEGVKSVTDVPRLVSYLGPRWAVFDPVYNAADLGDITLAPDEIRLLSAVDGVRTLRDLVAFGPGDAAHNARLLYAFATLRLIRRRDVSAKTAIRKIHWKTGGGDYTPEG